MAQVLVRKLEAEVAVRREEPLITADERQLAAARKARVAAELL